MPTEREKMLRGEFFNGDDPELEAMRRRARELIQALNNSGCEDEPLRQQIYAELFGSIGEWVSIQPPFYCDYGKNIILGSGVFFNFNCVVLDVAEVRIGNNVLFGPNVQIYAATHPVDAPTRYQNSEFGKPIRIGDEVWVGGSAMICPGVTIGSRTTVGAGSVVTRDLPDGVLAAGKSLPDHSHPGIALAPGRSKRIIWRSPSQTFRCIIQSSRPVEPVNISSIAPRS